MSEALFTPLPPELGPIETDVRSIHAFQHGFPSDYVRWHFHSDYELHLIVESAGKLFVGDHVYPFSPGQLILTGPYLPHNWVSRTLPGSIVETRDYVVQFREHLVRSMAAGAPELSNLLPLLERARHGVEFRGAVCTDAKPWFEEMIASDGASRLGLLIGFLEQLSQERDFRTLSMPLLDVDRDKSSFRKLEHVIRYVTQNCEGEISLTAVADLVNMSETSFSHFFSKATGGNFTHFVNGMRVSRACEMLRATDARVTEICHAAGFNNVANFNRRFREFRGMTPREYRKQARLGQAR